MEWEDQTNQETPFRGRAELKDMGLTIQAPKPGSCVRETHAIQRGWGSQAATVVVDLQCEFVGLASRSKSNSAGPGMRFDAVANGILHERLQDEVGHTRIERFRGGVNFHPEAAAESNLLDFEVAPQELQFLAQGHFLPFRVIERGAQ